MVIVLLLATLVALFVLMTICFVLGYEMPSIQDVVRNQWQEGCASTEDSQGCLQAELAANNWCHKNAATPTLCEDAAGGVTSASQKVHMCTVECQNAWIDLTQKHASDVAVGCWIAFGILTVLIMWNSQTHHGLWCISVTDNEDDDENTVMSIIPAMAYPAYVMNGALGLLGMSMTIASVAVLEDMASYTAIVAIVMGLGYFVTAGVAIVSVAKDWHMSLRVANLVYLATCPCLLVLSLVAAVYSGEIENVFDFYDSHWCKLRHQLEGVDAAFCSGLSDAACKQKIIDHSTEDLELLAFLIAVSLGAIICLIWFSIRMARKFAFSARETNTDSNTFEVEGASESDSDDDDDKGGGGQMERHVQIEIGLLTVPTLCVLVSVILVFASDGDKQEGSVACGMLSAHADFVNKTNSAGALLMDGKAILSMKRPDLSSLELPPNIEIGVTFSHSDTVDSFYDVVQVYELPVGANGDCSNLGSRYPASMAPPVGVVNSDYNVHFAAALKVQSAVADSPPYITEYEILDVPPHEDTAARNTHTLFGVDSIIGRSMKICKTAECLSSEDPPPQCATIEQTGITPTRLSAIFNATGSNIIGKVDFQQVTSVRDESDTTILVELEATAAGYPMVDLSLQISNAVVPTSATGEITHAACLAAGNVSNIFNINPLSNMVLCASATCNYNCKMEFCKTGDLTAKFAMAGSSTNIAVGTPGLPVRRFFVDKFWREGDPLSPSSAKQGGILLRGESSGVTGIGDGTHTLFIKDSVGTVMSCARIPSWFDFGR